MVNHHKPALPQSKAMENAKPEYYGAIPSGELKEFVDAECAHHETSLQIMDVVGSQVRAIEYVPIDERYRTLVQRQATPPIYIEDVAAANGAGLLEARIDMMFQMDIERVVGHQPSPTYEGLALLGMRLLVARGGKLQKEYRRPPFFTLGCLEALTAPFAPDSFAIILSGHLETLAHSNEARQEQAEYGEWLALMKQVVSPEA